MEQGRWLFRDFPGLLVAKENRTGSRQTLLRNCLSRGFRELKERTYLLLQPVAILNPLTNQFGSLLLIGLPIACISWTATHEEVFREPREFCKEKSKDCRPLYMRKLFYLFTCEYFGFRSQGGDVASPDIERLAFHATREYEVTWCRHFKTETQTKKLRAAGIYLPYGLCRV